MRCPTLSPLQLNTGYPRLENISYVHYLLSVLSFFCFVFFLLCLKIVCLFWGSTWTKSASSSSTDGYVREKWETLSHPPVWWWNPLLPCSLVTANAGSIPITFNPEGGPPESFQHASTRVQARHFATLVGQHNSCDSLRRKSPATD